MFQVIPNKTVIFSIHLSSKAEKNPQQMQELKELIKILQEKIPDRKVIFVGDLNSPFFLKEG